MSVTGDVIGACMEGGEATAPPWIFGKSQSLRRDGNNQILLPKLKS
jgi:hypothetical protein